MEHLSQLLATLQPLEQELLTSSVRKSGRVAELLADAFCEFGSSGTIYSKAQIIAALAEEDATTISADRFAVRLVAPGVALLTYRACRHSVHGVHSLRSSLWQLQGGQWRMLFHQGTPCALAEHG